jgi:hypothetical protein
MKMDSIRLGVVFTLPLAISAGAYIVWSQQRRASLKKIGQEYCMTQYNAYAECMAVYKDEMNCRDAFDILTACTVNSKETSN